MNHLVNIETVAVQLAVLAVRRGVLVQRAWFITVLTVLSLRTVHVTTTISFIKLARLGIIIAASVSAGKTG